MYIYKKQQQQCFRAIALTARSGNQNTRSEHKNLEPDNGVIWYGVKMPDSIRGPRGCHEFQTSKTLMLSGISHQGTHYA